MEDFKAVNVPITVSVTPEALEILNSYAGERNKGRFISQLLVAQRQRDEAEGERIAAEMAAQRAVKAVDAATKAREKYSIPNPRQNKRRGR